MCQGYSVASPGSQSESPCGDGTYSSTAGSSSCEPVPTHSSVKRLNGLNTGFTCDDGYEAVGDECQPCEAGSAGTGGTCAQCAAG
jgi:hypothetical protein